MGGRPLAASSPASRDMGASRVAPGRPRLPSPPRVLAVDRPGGASGAADFPILSLLWGGPPWSARVPPDPPLAMQSTSDPTQEGRRRRDPGGPGGPPHGQHCLSALYFTSKSISSWASTLVARSLRTIFRR